MTHCIHNTGISVAGIKYLLLGFCFLLNHILAHLSRPETRSSEIKNTLGFFACFGALHASSPHLRESQSLLFYPGFAIHTVHSLERTSHCSTASKQKKFSCPHPPFSDSDAPKIALQEKVLKLKVCSPLSVGLNHVFYTLGTD